MLNADECYAAMQRRDPTADGVFFVAVRTTRIYCRPICPARIPLRRNTLFFRSAAAAQAAGFRPCLRCRPESAPDSPAWIGSLASINRALRLIDEGFLIEGNVEELAACLGMTARHLRRLFKQHVGTGPLAVERTRRIHLAKKLLHETSLPITEIALAAGFGSVRRFNEVFLAMFGRPPGMLRRRSAAETVGAPFLFSLSFRPPLTWGDLLAKAAGNGIEVDQDKIFLSLTEFGCSARACVRWDEPQGLSVTLAGVPLRDIGVALSRTKRRVLGGLEDPGGSDIRPDAKQAA